MKMINQGDEKKLEDLKEKASEALGILKERLEILLEKAEEYQDERSDRWQESEAGELYKEWTERIQDKIDEIDSIFDDVEGIEFDEILAP